MAFLEPATVTLLGGRYSDLEEGQLKDFKRGLYTRLGCDTLNEIIILSRLTLSADAHFLPRQQMQRMHQNLQLCKQQRLSLHKQPCLL